MSINQVYDYVEANFRVFALWEITRDGKCGCDDPDCIAVGKHPRISGWNRTPYQDDGQIETMQEYLVSTGFGVCLDNHLVLDIDPRNDGDTSYRKLQEDLGVDLNELSGCVVATGGGGWHVYFSTPTDALLMSHHKDYPGIDFKNGTTGASFVVGAGSLHASGSAYEFEKGNPCYLTEIPECLLNLLRRKESKNKSYDGTEVTNTEIEQVLSHIPNSDVHYDDWIKVGMAIHDATHGAGFNMWDEWSMQSAKYNPQMMDQRWHSFGKSANPVRIGTLFHMAEENGYIRPVTFESAEITYDEADVVDHTPKPKHVRMLESLLASDDAEMLRVSNMAWLIDGLIPAESFGVVFGEPGCGKSFTMVDMSCAVASGSQWQGLDTGDEGVVIYISAEGGNGMRFRKRAWEQKHVRAPLMRVLPITTIMDDPKDVGQLTQVIREYRKHIDQPIKMIVIDTLNRSMAGNENDNSDMAQFIRGCELVQHDHKCGVVVVHHSGKDAEKGARGASALKAATDFEIMVSKLDNMITVKNTRAKDVEPLPPILCKAEVVTIEGYTDYKGRPITSLVPMPASFSDALSASLVMTERETILLDVIREVVNREGRSDRRCERSDVREAFKAKIGLNGGKFDQAFSMNLKSLKSKGSIHYDRQEIELIEF